MTSRPRIVFLLLIFVMACGRGGPSGCGRDKGPGGVNVVLALPKGPVEWVSSVDVSFDQSMVELGATTKAGDEPFRIKPKVPGRFTWIGTRTASFIPEKPLPPSTRYQVVVPAGLRSVDGKSVAEDVAWEFTTPLPEVVRSFPEEGERHAAPTIPIILEFNVPVDPGQVRRAARLAAVGAEANAVDLKARRPDEKDADAVRYWPKTPETHRVVLTPSRPLGKDTDWILTLSAEFKGTDGPLPMETPYRLPFRTYGPFRIRGIRSTDAASGTVILDISNPVEPDSLIRYLVFDPPVKLRGGWQGPDPSETGIYGDFRPGTNYRLTVRPGLVDLFGNPIEPPAGALEFLTGDLGPSIRIFPQDAVLERGGRRQVAVLLTNVGEASLEFQAVSPEQLSGHLREDYFGRTRRTWEWPLQNPVRRRLVRRTPNNVTDTVYVSTDEVLGAGGGGILAIQAVSLDPRPPSTPDGMQMEPPRDRTMVRVTDLGLTAKSSESDGIAWVTSLASAEPLAGVALEVRDVNGGLVWRGTSDARGLAALAGLPAQGPTPPAPFRLFARRGDDVTYLTLGRDWSLEAWNFGVQSERWDPARDLDGFIYGDRELYRPGETVHLKAILRRRNESGLAPPAAGTTVRLDVRDPRGNPLAGGLHRLTAFGTLDKSIVLDRSARPGTYSVSVTDDVPPEQQRWALYGSFRIEEYKAPEFTVEAVSKRPWYTSGQLLEAEVTASYFFGAPLSGGTAAWSLSRRPAWFQPEGYDDYSFNDPEITPEYVVLAGRGEARLDERGHAAVTPALDLGGIPVSMDYTFEVEVRDLTGQASAAETRVTVHRGLAYPGVKIGRNLVRAGETVPVSVVLVGPDGKPATDGGGKVSLVRREWRTARRLLVGGAIGAETTPVDTVLEVTTLPAGPGPHALRFTADGPGYYRVVAEATDRSKNILKSAAYFYASGPGEYAWGWEPGVRLDLVTDRERYSPGDTALVLIRSPFANARALVTVERENVREAWTRQLAGTSETVAIPIPVTGAAPNLHVSVALVTGSDARDGADPRIRLPEFRMGYATLPIDHASRVLAVDVRPDRPEALPGDSMRVAVTLKDAAGRPVSGEFSIAVVDEAVLRLLGTRTPDPVAHFYRPRGVSVVTSELRRLVKRALGEGGDKGEAGGGGGEDPFRSLFATTAYWNAAVSTGASGSASVGFRLPDNLTTFRVMVVALDAADRFGSGEKTILVTKPLLVQPATPRFAHAGDRFRVGAVVHNRTDLPFTVNVTAEAAGVRLTGPGERSLDIPAGDSRRADFEVEAPAIAGLARVRFSGRAGERQDGVAISFPIVLPVAPRTEATAGTLAGPVTEGITVPADAFPDSSRIEVTLAPSLIGGATEAFEYLENYPYLCLEQVASAEWARLLRARLHGLESTIPPGEMAVRRLAPYQKEDGGFALWPGTSNSAPGITAYALLVLAEAGRAGVNVEPLVTPAARYLQWNMESIEADSVARLTLASRWGALALWALSETHGISGEGRFPGSALEFLTASRARLDATARLYLSMAWRKQPGGNEAARLILSELDNRAEQRADMAWLRDQELEGPVDRSPVASPSDGPREAARPGRRSRTVFDGEVYYERAWYSPVRLTGLYLAASAGSGRRSPLEPQIARWLLDQRREGRWPSTQENIMALLGLAAYREVYESEPPRVTLQVSYGTQPVATARFTSLRDAPVVESLPAGAPGSAASLQFTREGTGAAYYTAGLRYLEPTVGKPPVETSLTLVRSYETFDPGRTGTSKARDVLTAGDLVLVRLTLVLPEEADFLVIADPLPAGLEPVQLGFVTTAREAADRLLQTGVYEPGRQGLPTLYEEQRDREVRAFTGYVPAGVYEYRYIARAITPGRYAAPRARAELMYHPQVMALTDGPTIEVRPQ